MIYHVLKNKSFLLQVSSINRVLRNLSSRKDPCDGIITSPLSPSDPHHQDQIAQDKLRLLGSSGVGGGVHQNWPRGQWYSSCSGYPLGTPNLGGRSPDDNSSNGCLNSSSSPPVDGYTTLSVKKGETQNTFLLLGGAINQLRCLRLVGLIHHFDIVAKRKEWSGKVIILDFATPCTRLKQRDKKRIHLSHSWLAKEKNGSTSPKG